MAQFKLALVQMYVEGGARKKNLAHASEMIQRATDQGAKVVVLPEAMNLGWTHPSARKEADPIPNGESCQALRRAARVNRVYVCSGLVERDKSGVYNAAVLIDPKGKVLIHHRKLNELTIGHNLYGQGNRLSVAQTPLGAFGVMICADGFARDRVLTHSLCYMGADIIFSPSSWAMPGTHDPSKGSKPYGKLWRDAYRPVAKNYSVWIAGVSDVGWVRAGPWKGRKRIGCSLLIAPGGREVFQGPYGPDAETILFADVKLTRRPTRGCGWEELWSSKGERKFFHSIPYIR